MLLELAPGMAEQDLRVRGIGSQGCRAGCGSGSARIVAQCEHRARQLQVGFGQIRVEFDRPLTAAFRGRRIAGAILGARKVCEGFGKFRIDSYRPAEDGDRLRQPAGVLEDDPE